MANYVFFNDKIVSDDKAKINIRDLGFLRGYGVFDLAFAQGAMVHKLDAHLERFFKSAKRLSLKIPYAKDQLKEIIDKLLQKNKYTFSSIRLILTGGVSNDGRTVDEETFLIINDPIKLYPEELYEKGVKVITRDYKRNTPKAKALNYQYAFSIYQNNTPADAFEIIYTPNNSLLEGATSNVFLVKDGKLITANDGILEGITRQEVIDLASKSGIQIEIRNVLKEELFEADEVFLTATLKKIMPVVCIDGKDVGGGQPGPMTRELISKIKND